MVGNPDRNPIVIMKFSSKAAHTGLTREEGLSRHASECTDNLGLYNFNLAAQIGHAGSDLLDRRVAILRGSALDDIGDVDLLTFQPHALINDIVEQLAGLADKRLSGKVFIPPGALSNKKQAGTRVPHPENCIGSSLTETAELAAGHLGLKGLEGQPLVLPWAACCS